MGSTNSTNSTTVTTAQLDLSFEKGVGRPPDPPVDEISSFLSSNSGGSRLSRNSTLYDTSFGTLCSRPSPAQFLSHWVLQLQWLQESATRDISHLLK